MEYTVHKVQNNFVKIATNQKITLPHLRYIGRTVKPPLKYFYKCTLKNYELFVKDGLINWSIIKEKEPEIKEAIKTIGQKSVQGEAIKAAKSIIVVGSSDACDGYGTAAEQLIKVLKMLGYDARGSGLFNMGRPGRAEVITAMAPAFLGSSYYKEGGITFSTIESDRLPESWVSSYKESRLNMVMSNFNRETFERSGVKNVEVLPLYIREEYQPIERDWEKGAFGFLTYSNTSFNHFRKGYKYLAEAWIEKFKGNNKVNLTMKFTIGNVMGVQAGKACKEEEYGKLMEKLLECGNVKIITRRMSNEELLGLMKQSHCFIYPSMGEGLGYCFREGMATGMAAIVTGGSAMTEWMPEGSTEYINCKKVEASQYYQQHSPGRFSWSNMGNLCLLDVKHLGEIMVSLYENREKARKMGQEATKIRQILNKENTAKELKRIFDKYGVGK